MLTGIFVELFFVMKVNLRLQKKRKNLPGRKTKQPVRSETWKSGSVHKSENQPGQKDSDTAADSDDKEIPVDPGHDQADRQGCNA